MYWGEGVGSLGLIGLAWFRLASLGLTGLSWSRFVSLGLTWSPLVSHNLPSLKGNGKDYLDKKGKEMAQTLLFLSEIQLTATVPLRIYERNKKTIRSAPLDLR